MKLKREISPLPALSPGLLEYAQALNLIIQKNAFYGFTVFHADQSEAIGGFLEQDGSTHYSSFIGKKSMSTDNYRQGLRFILQCYNEQHKQAIAHELKKNQMQLLF